MRYSNYRRRRDRTYKPKRNLKFLRPGWGYFEYGKVVPVDEQYQRIAYHGDWGDYTIANPQQIDIVSAAHILYIGCSAPWPSPDSADPADWQQWGYGRITPTHEREVSSPLGWFAHLPFLRSNGNGKVETELVEKRVPYNFLLWLSYPGRKVWNKATTYLVFVVSISPLDDDDHQRVYRGLGDQVAPWYGMV